MRYKVKNFKGKTAAPEASIKIESYIIGLYMGSNNQNLIFRILFRIEPWFEPKLEGLWRADRVE